MRRAILFAALWVWASGCNWSDLDAEFLAAMPQRASLRVDPPVGSQKEQGLGSSGLATQRSALKSQAAQDLQTNADNLNHLIDSLTAGLDVVRKIPPTLRETDLRAWGPYADEEHPGFEIRVAIAREVDGYSYAVQWRAEKTTDFASVISGEFKGDTASNGTGRFVLDAVAARTIGLPFDPSLKQATLSYEHPDKTTQVHVESVTPTGSGSYQHVKRSDGSGGMSYVTQDPATGWQLHVTAAWLASQAGAVGALAYHPSWPLVAGHYQECWDTALESVFFFKDFVDPQCSAAPCTAGSAQSCVVAPPTPGS